MENRCQSDGVHGVYGVPGRDGNPQRGFATALVLLFLVITGVTGGLLLKFSKRQSASTTNYFQARSATLAAQSGLQAGLASLAENPADAVIHLNAYLQDNSKSWLLNGTGNAGRRIPTTLGSTEQSYATRIMAFDPATNLVKLESEGMGPGGSVSQAYGVYQLDGLKSLQPDLAHFAWYMAGEARNIDQPVHVYGDAYFGGDIHFNGGADNSVFHGAVKIARGSGGTSSFDAKVSFLDDVYFQTPVSFQGNASLFYKRTGFEANIRTDNNPRWLGSGQPAYFNANVNGGNGKLDFNGNPVFTNGQLNQARTLNGSSFTQQGSDIDIAAALGQPSGTEEEITFSMSSIPSGKIFTPGALGIGVWGGLTGPELSSAYAAAKNSGDLYRGFLVVRLSSGYRFDAVANNILDGNFLFEVTAPINVNGNLPISDPGSVALWHIGSSGNMQGFGGPGLVRGYVNVSGTGSMIYQWGPAGEMQGAIHHVSAASNFQLNGPSPLKLTFDKNVFDELAVLGVLIPAGQSVPPPPIKEVKLVDVRVRPRFLSSYF
jgi:hypothetical protein